MTKFRKVMALSVVILSLCTTAFAEGKIDPLLMIMAESPEAAVNSMASFGVNAPDGTPTTEVIIKARYGEADAAKALIEELGGSVRVVIGEIMTATIPIAIIADLDNSELIDAVEAAKPVTNKMNAARGSTGSNADQVQAGTCTGCSPITGGGYTGTDVIVGVIDSGIDCQHADFKNSAGTTRIINYLDQTTTPSTDYTSAQLADGTCSGSSDAGGHGTHVTGIAAGSNSTYTGVASTSSIIAVKMADTDGSSGGSFSTYLLEAANYIFTKADALNKAAVINISQGTSLGAHDGTSLLEQGLDALLVSSGTDKKGKAIVNAAGNENIMSNDADFAKLGGIHALINVAAGTDNGYEVYVRSSPYVVAAGGAIVDFWLDSGTTCTVKAEGYNRNTGAKAITMDSWVSYGAATATATDNSATISLSYSETAASGKKHGVVTINRTNADISDTVLANYYFVFMLSGTCTGNAWLYPDYTSRLDFTKLQQTAPAPAGFTYLPGNSDMTITIPGTASKVITVASYMDRASWMSMNGTEYFQTAQDGTCSASGGTNLNISLFSSIGPTASATASDLLKPDIAAPGEPILATLASNISEATDVCSKGDATHYKLEGTSMASPHVAGAVALMFQKNKCLTSTEVKQYMKTSATVDTQTGTPPPPYTWGAGKLNAAAVMNQFQAASSCDSPTPSGGSGCSLLSAGNGDKPSVALLVACLALCCLTLCLTRRIFAQRKM